MLHIGTCQDFVSTNLYLSCDPRLNQDLRYPFEIVGKLRFKVRFDPGLDEEHERLATDQKKQHSYDVYMAAEGINAQLTVAHEGRGEDDPKTKREKQLEQRDLHRHGRGVMQIKPMRSAFLEYYLISNIFA